MRFRHWFRRRDSELWNLWPDSAYKKQPYQHRLSTVQEHLAKCLDAAPVGSLRIISICAGDGRDVIGVLESHRRRSDVSACLLEQNPQSVAAGVCRSTTAGLENTVAFLNVDATAYATYKNLAPADIVLLCGVWGHVPADERGQLVQAVASLCNPGGTVIWTRGVAKGMIRLRQIQIHFAAPAWDQVRLSLTRDNNWAVVTHRYCGPTGKLPASGRIFNFRAGAGTR